MSNQVEMRCRCGEVRRRSRTRRRGRSIAWFAIAVTARRLRITSAAPTCLTRRAAVTSSRSRPPHSPSCRDSDRIVGLRLTPKGLFRWYANCCNTPLGNTLTPKIPFVGIIAQAFDNGPQRSDDVFGPPIGAILGKHAIGVPPAGSTGLNLSLMLRAIACVLGWRLRGKAWPHPFFNTSGPIYPLTVLPHEQREALRALCGPHPTAQAVAR